MAKAHAYHFPLTVTLGSFFELWYQFFWHISVVYLQIQIIVIREWLGCWWSRPYESFERRGLGRFVEGTTLSRGI